MCFYISVFVDVPSYVPINLFYYKLYTFLISDIFDNCQCEDALFPERGVMLYFWGIPLLDHQGRSWVVFNVQAHLCEVALGPAYVALAIR